MSWLLQEQTGTFESGKTRMLVFGNVKVCRGLSEWIQWQTSSRTDCETQSHALMRRNVVVWA